MPEIALASDHAGFDLKEELASQLLGWGYSVKNLGPINGDARVDYPDFAVTLADVVPKHVPLGVLVCGTGIGMSIAANKIPGVRAAVCRSEFEARMARAHNDANVLCLGQRVTGPGLATEILKAFVSQAFDGGRHSERVEKIRRLEVDR